MRAHQHQGGMRMDDLQIIELYFNRSEEAISETAKKYGTYCYVIANNILHSEPDAEECVNDTYLRAWNAIPPARPTRFSAFLAKITRNLAFNRYASLHAQKRCGEAEIALEELSEVLSDPNAEIEHSENDALKDAINRFLGLLSHDARVIFIRRYF